MNTVQRPATRSAVLRRNPKRRAGAPKLISTSATPPGAHPSTTNTAAFLATAVFLTMHAYSVLPYGYASQSDSRGRSAGLGRPTMASRSDLMYHATSAHAKGVYGATAASRPYAHGSDIFRPSIVSRSARAHVVAACPSYTIEYASSAMRQMCSWMYERSY